MREGRSASRPGQQSKARQAREKGQAAAQQVQEKTQPAVEQTREKAQEIRAQAAARLRDQLGVRSTQAAEQVQSVGNALRTTSEELRGQGQERPAKVAEEAAKRAEQLGEYLRNADGEKILRDSENLARRQPWLVAAGGGLVGFVAARFLKTSSRGATDESGNGQRTRVSVEETRAATEAPAATPPRSVATPRPS